LRSYPRGKAISHFCRLTDESFAGLRWAQPYSPAEVEEQLRSAEDLLFLAAGSDLIGVAWLRHTDDRATIEPFAVRPTYQGRGYGAQLLAAVLSEAEARGARRVSIGAWEENVRALSLYRRFGFTDAGRIFYLSRSL
jgi:ribosomal protein S18 acetylase RimI-like enzyme